MHFLAPTHLRSHSINCEGIVLSFIKSFDFSFYFLNFTLEFIYFVLHDYPLLLSLV